MRLMITNETGEKIEIEQGDTLEVRGDVEKKRVLASRISFLKVEETGKR